MFSRRRFISPAIDELDAAAGSKGAFCVFRPVFGGAEGEISRRLAMPPLCESGVGKQNVFVGLALFIGNLMLGLGLFKSFAMTLRLCGRDTGFLLEVLAAILGLLL